MHSKRYLVEQLWMLGVGLIYAVTMVFDYWRAASGERSPVSTVVPWIQQMILYAGVVLIGLVVLRASWVIWSTRQLRQHGSKQLAGRGEHHHDHHHHPHHHHHHHDHDHDHHDNADSVVHLPISELAALREEETVSVSAHAHATGHEHEHDWSPWRFFVLLAPILLVLLPLDWGEMLRAFERSKSRIVTEAISGGLATPGDSLLAFGLWSLSHDPLARSVAAAMCQYRAADQPASLEKVLDYLDENAEVPESAIRRTDVVQLEQVAYVPAQREHWKQFRRIEVEGLYQPVPNRRNQFAVVRLRMACCINDSRPLSVFAVSRRPIIGVQPGDWIRVQGRLDFVNLPDGSWKAVIHAYRVEKAPLPPPAQFYVQ